MVKIGVNVQCGALVWSTRKTECCASSATIVLYTATLGTFLAIDAVTQPCSVSITTSSTVYWDTLHKCFRLDRAIYPPR